MHEAYICDAIRTPFGRYGGALAAVRADDLAAAAIAALMARHPGADWESLDDVVLAGQEFLNAAFIPFLQGFFQNGVVRVAADLLDGVQGLFPCKVVIFCQRADKFGNR